MSAEITPTPYEDLMDPEPNGALARWQVNLKRYANQIRRDYPTAAVTIGLVCREMEAARKALKRNRAKRRKHDPQGRNHPPVQG